MNTITTKFLAATVAITLLLTFSLPAQAALYANPGSASGLRQGDDDDDGLSGGALAVLLLAIGGAVAGTLHGPGSIRTQSRLSVNRVSASKAIVSVERNAFGRRKTTGWTSVLDGRSGMIKLSGNGRQWTGKPDGRYYPLTGDPTADELSITSVGNRGVEFRTKKAGRIASSGTITVSDNGQSVSINTEGTDQSGRRRSRRAVFSAR